MDTKEYLSRLNEMDKHIKVKLKQLGELRQTVYSISVALDPDKVQTSRSQGKIDAMMARILDLENEIGEEIADYFELYSEINHKISLLESKEEQDVLVARYVIGKSKDEMENYVGMSRAKVTYVLRSAIGNFEKVLEKESLAPISLV